MKKLMKYFSFVLLILLSFILFAYKEKINVFAETKKFVDIEIGDIFKNGDVLPYDEPIDICKFLPGDDNCVFNYSVIVFYLDENNNYVDSVSFPREHNWMTGEFAPIDVVIDNDVSEYWIFDSVMETSSLNFVFKPYIYNEPTFDLVCNFENNNTENYYMCSFKTNYFTKIENINLSFEDSDLEITDIRAGEHFNDLNVTDGIYSLTSKSFVSNSNDGDEIDVLTFKVSYVDVSVIESELKVKDVNYSTKVSNNTVDEIKAKVVKESIITPSDETNTGKKEEIDVNNPKTGDSSYFGIFLVILLGNVGLFLFIYKREESKL